MSDLAARASTLRERIDGDVEPTRTGRDRAERRLAEWSRVVARGDDAAFAERLAIDGLDHERALDLLGDVRWRGPAPEWTRIVEEAVERVTAEPDDEALLAVCRAEGAPVALPFVRAARARIVSELGPLWSDTAPAVRAADESRLAAQIAWTLRFTIDEALRAERDRRYDRLSAAIMTHAAEPPCEFHDDVVEGLATTGFATVVDDHAAVARRAAAAALDWIEATAEFHRRLAADRPAIEAMLAHGEPLGALIGYGDAISDAHGGGRSVRQCAFASGTSVMYKPKTVRTEAVFGRIAEALGRDDERLRLRVPRVLDRGGYGWTEFIRQAPAESDRDVELYHLRAGALLALLHALGGYDMHLENLIAACDQPVVIDAETIIGAVPRLSRGVIDADADSTLGVVVGIGILPQWVEGHDGRIYDVSVLGAREEQDGPFESMRWASIGTDAARLELGFGRLPVQGNVLMRDGAPVRCEDHVDAVSTGFRDGYARVRAIADELGTLLDELADVEIRFVLRATRLYARALRAAERSATLRAGVDRSIQLEVLLRPVLDAPDPGTWTAIARSELAALERGDIPAFGARATSDRIETDGVDVPLVCNAIDRAKQRLLRLDDADRDFQLGFVRQALLLRGGTDGTDRAPDLAPARAIDGARALAHAIADEAVVVAPGHAIWIAPERNLETDRWRLSPAGADIYNGAPGIALALAAYARIADDDAIRAAARTGIRAIVEDIERKPSRYPARYGIGLASGCAGIALALHAIAAQLDDASYADAADALLDAIDEEHVAADGMYDLLAGSAGLLHVATRCDRRALAVRAAERLARGAVDIDGAAGWAGIMPIALTGASHGTTGIGAALVLAGDHFGEPAWVDLGRRALAHDDARFDPALAGWPDLRRDDRTTGGGMWCHGAPGFVLAYGALGRSSIAAEMDQRIARADAALAAAPVHTSDHLCCGAAGWCEAARASAALAPDVEAWRAAAAGRAVADCLAIQGRYGGITSRAASLMIGRSGVLWGLLAAEDPELEPLAGIAIS